MRWKSSNSIVRKRAIHVCTSITSMLGRVVSRAVLLTPSAEPFVPFIGRSRAVAPFFSVSKQHVAVR
jgi:hypothetical protein